MLSLLNPDFKLSFFGGTLVIGQGSRGPLRKKFFDICNENNSSKTNKEQQQNANTQVWHTASVQYLWPVANKNHALLILASADLFASDVVLAFLLPFEKLSPIV